MEDDAPRVGREEPGFEVLVGVVEREQALERVGVRDALVVGGEESDPGPAMGGVDEVGLQ